MKKLIFFFLLSTVFCFACTKSGRSGGTGPNRSIRVSEQGGNSSGNQDVTGAGVIVPDNEDAVVSDADVQKVIQEPLVMQSDTGLCIICYSFSETTNQHFFRGMKYDGK